MGTSHASLWAVVPFGAAIVLAITAPLMAENACSGHEYTGRRISLDFKDADVVNVLRFLSDIGGENLVITDDVKGRMTLRLVDVPWDQAFDVVLEMNRLSCVKLGVARAVSG